MDRSKNFFYPPRRIFISGLKNQATLGKAGKMHHISGGIFRDTHGVEVFELDDEKEEPVFRALPELVEQFIKESDSMQILLEDTTQELLSKQLSLAEFDASVVRDLWSIGNLEDARLVLMEANIKSLEKSMKYARQSGEPRHFHTQGLRRQIVPYAKNDHAFGHPAIESRFVVLEARPDGTLRAVPCLVTVDFILRDIKKCNIVGHETEHFDLFLSKILANMCCPLRGDEDSRSTKRHIGISQSLLNEAAAQHPGEYKVGELDLYCAAALSNYKKLIQRPEFFNGMLEVQEKVQHLGEYKFFCGACKKAGPTKKCSACGRIHYCSKKCQRRDWKAHKPFCQ